MGFLQEDAGSVLGAGQHHVVVAVQPPGSHADDLRTFLAQHFPVVRVAGLDAQSGGRFLEAFLVLIGDCHQFRPVHRQPDPVQAVPIVAAIGSADDGDPVFLAHDFTSQKALGTMSILAVRGESLTQHRDRGQVWLWQTLDGRANLMSGIRDARMASRRVVHGSWS